MGRRSHHFWGGFYIFSLPTLEPVITTSLEGLSMPQERIDCTTVDSEFKLSEAISSLKFYWNLARHTKTPLVYELWAEAGAVVPPMQPKLQVPEGRREVILSQS